MTVVDGAFVASTYWTLHRLKEGAD